MLISWKYLYIPAPVPFIYIAIKSGLILPDPEMLTVKQSHTHINHLKWKKRVNILLTSSSISVGSSSGFKDSSCSAAILRYHLKIPIRCYSKNQKYIKGTKFMGSIFAWSRSFAYIKLPFPPE
jgi:hypothetical protein